jgi:hypothetical protein
MSDTVIEGTEFNCENIKYSSPKTNSVGGKSVNIFSKTTNSRLNISTPMMLTWGASDYVDKSSGQGNGKFEMSLQFPNADYSTPDAEGFLSSMRALEAKIKADALTYSKEWFGKTITSPDVMDEKFNVMLRHPKKEKGSVEPDLSKPPTLTVKVPNWKGVWQSEIYDEEGNPLFLKGKSPSHTSPLDFLKPKTHVICLIQCGGLWFVNGKVSITWNLKQAIVQKPKTSSIVEGTCFLKPKAADVQKLKTLPPPEDDIDPDGAVTSTIVEDSDDEDEELPPPPPVKPAVVEPVVEKVAEVVVEEPKKKKVVTKKKVES